MTIPLIVNPMITGIPLLVAMQAILLPPVRQKAYHHYGREDDNECCPEFLDKPKQDHHPGPGGQGASHGYDVEETVSTKNIWRMSVRSAILEKTRQNLAIDIR